MNTLSRKPSEADDAYAARLLLDPMFESSTDAEIAEYAKLRVDVVKTERERILCWSFARDVARAVGCPNMDPSELIRKLLVEHAWSVCEAGRCTHKLCTNGRTYAAALERVGVKLRLVDGDRFLSEPRAIPDYVRAWIVTNREAIVAELRGVA